MKRLISMLAIMLILVGVNAQIFSPKQLIAIANNPQVIKAADFNSDGYDDIVYSSITDHAIAISFYNPTTGDFDAQTIVSTSFNYAVSLFTADLDGDSFIDFLTVSQQNHKVAWFRNDGTGNFTLQPLISSDAQGAICVIATDIDGDNDLDVVASSKDNHKIQWYENTDGNGNFSAANLITDSGEYPTVIISADIDNDNDPDIVAGKLQSNKIVWFENDGNGNFGSENLITSEINNISSLVAADLNNDNYIDIVSASKSDNKIAWYENIEGSGSFSSQNIIFEEAIMAFDVIAADFDLDNDIDIICSVMGSNQILQFNNTDGLGNFSYVQDLSFNWEKPKGICPGDFDNDGDIDVAATHSDEDPDEVVWYENGAPAFLVHNLFLEREVIAIDAYDVTNDGNNDIFYTDRENVFMVENQNSGQSFGEEILLYEGGYNIFSLKLVDIDNDGDQDLFVADGMGDKVFWLENTDGNGTFSSDIVIDAQGNGPINLEFSDIDDDGDLDLFVPFVNENSLAIFENIDGLGTFTKTIIHNDVIHGTCLVDIDNDNDDDIAYSTSDNAKYMLNDGSGTFSPPVIFSNQSYSWEMTAADLNNDDFEDIIFIPEYNLHWLENNHNNTFDDHQVDMWGSVYNITYGDLDNDNDYEILVSSPNVNRINIVENIDFGEEMNTTFPIMVERARSVKVSDINNDGYWDVLIGAAYPSESLFWAENFQYKILNHPFDQYVCQGESASFSVLSTGVITYQWQMNTGSGFSDISNNATYSGAYKAQLKINNVTEDMFNNEFRCLVYNKNNEELITGAAVLYQDCVNIDERENTVSGVLIYPNPTTDIFSIKTLSGFQNIVQFEITDLTGKLIYSQPTFRNPQLEIDFSSQPKGVYFIKIQTETDIITKKILVN